MNHFRLIFTVGINQKNLKCLHNKTGYFQMVWKFSTGHTVQKIF